MKKLYQTRIFYSDDIMILKIVLSIQLKILWTKYIYII